ncbi:uncharacterized protein LOC132945618 [Metopolophium dirhodum]|uniref:uncharacterized protein LOC132945618 n=1 Tax=Metopolophium dirhodum TaxID=44670 RepID=UPI00298F9F11|nr:uncharacterized protein LOC132945618 [Metopolophium dirhodum]
MQRKQLSGLRSELKRLHDSGDHGWVIRNSYGSPKCDRNNTTSGCSRGGGILVDICVDLLSYLIPVTCLGIEVLFAIFTLNRKKYIINSAYLPPNSPPQSYETFMSTVKNLLSIYSDHFFIFCGDFNVPHVSWSNDCYGLVYSSTSGSLINCLPETFAANNFFQINDIFNKSGPLLDLIFVNLIQYKVKSALNPVVPEDRYHPALYIDFIPVTNIPQIYSSHYYFNFRKANYLLINTFLLSFNWLDTFSNLDVTSAAYALFDTLHLSILRHVPSVKLSRSNFPLWFSKDLIDLVFQNRKAHAIFKCSNNSNDYQNFSFLRAKYKYLSKQCYKKFISSTKETFCANPSKFWDFVRKNKSGQSTPMTVTLNGLTSKNNNEVVYFFSKHFNSVYSRSNVNYIPELTQSLKSLIHYLPSNCFYDISDVDKGLSRLKGNNSTGPDGISGDFLFAIRSPICFPLWLLFRKSLDSRSYPEILKLSFITPVFKSGDIFNVANYRLITIISHIGKLFESLVLSCIQPAVNQIIVDEQHGFMQSCVN